MQGLLVKSVLCLDVVISVEKSTIDVIADVRDIQVIDVKNGVVENPEGEVAKAVNLGNYTVESTSSFEPQMTVRVHTDNDTIYAKVEVEQESPDVDSFSSGMEVVGQ